MNLAQENVRILKDLGMKPEVLAMYKVSELCIIQSEPRPNPDPSKPLCIIDIVTMEGQKTVTVEAVETPGTLESGESRWRMQKFLQLVGEIPAEAFKAKLGIALKTATPEGATCGIPTSRRTKILHVIMKLHEAMGNACEDITIMEGIEELNAIIDGRRD